MEGTIDLSEAAPVFQDVKQRAQAIDKFRRIITHFEDGERPPPSRACERFNRPTLVRLTFDYAGQVSRCFFFFFSPKSLALGMLNNDDIDLGDYQEVASLRAPLFSFADHLIYHFFLPCMSSLSGSEMSFLTAS